MIVTKVRIDVLADKALRAYFAEHEHEIEGWYNVIAPRGKNIAALREDLMRRLTAKEWQRIHGA